MWTGSRRKFLQTTGAIGAASWAPDVGTAQVRGPRPVRSGNVEVLNPKDRVPLSFIIDDSTCLVNLNRFAIPQFAAAWKGKRYHHDWRKMPVEIPDAFVRKFGEWCAERSIKGKYSIVPYPACVGRVDRLLPGWTKQELDNSLKLVRDLMLPNWDIHPEMVTHTVVVDTKTGQPLRDWSLQSMENWDWATGKSADQIADYMAYALRMLKNVGLPCEGITTPGGFASRVLPELSIASKQAVEDVFAPEIPHYFKHVIASGDRSVAPRIEQVTGLGTKNTECVVSLVACTGDWTGGWDCSNRGYLDKFITADLSSGRMFDVIKRGEPAIMLCHWTGIYFNGEEVGLKVFQEAVRRMHQRFDNLQWMKLSEIARYWAAKELTASKSQNKTTELNAPYACPDFTLRIKQSSTADPAVIVNGKAHQLTQTKNSRQLEAGRWLSEKPSGKEPSTVVCFNLAKGQNIIQLR